MYNFTDSPFEKMMKQRPSGCREPVAAPPPDSPCRGCTIWRGMACLGMCHRKTHPAKEGATSGPRGPKSQEKDEKRPDASP